MRRDHDIDADGARVPFRVRNVSSFDDSCSSATALEERVHPQSSGWISSRFCVYPQEITLQLDRPVSIKQIQILSHQSMIASRIELFVGRQLGKYTRLGYMSLDPNRRSSYKARELKTVDLQIQSESCFIHLVIHQHHANDVNVYGQVGLVAVKVLGHRIDGADLADLSLDVECDPQTARLLRRLNEQKLRAVQDEDYDEAGRLKHQIQSIRGIGSQLARLEADKLAAVQREDYDMAKAIKSKMDLIRHQNMVGQSLPAAAASGACSNPTGAPSIVPGASTHTRASSPSNTSATIHSTAAPITANQESPAGSYPPPAVLPYDERPLPAQLKGSLAHSTSSTSINPFGDRAGSSGTTPLEAPTTDAENLIDSVSSISEPPPLSDADRDQHAALIATFGDSITALLLSKKAFQHRVNALDEIDAIVTRSSSSPVPDVDTITLALSAVALSLPDPICQVCVRAMGVVETIIDSVLPSLSLHQVQELLDPILPTILSIMDLSSGRSRDKARHVFNLLVDYPSIIGPYLTQPLKNLEAHRPLQGRVELLTILIESSGLSDESSLRLETIVMQFALPALRHKKASVRQTGVNMTVALHSRVGNALLPYLHGVMNSKLEATLMKTFRDRQLQQHQRQSNGSPSSSVSVPAFLSLSPGTIHNRRGSPPQRHRETSSRLSLESSEEDRHRQIVKTRALSPVPAPPSFTDEADDESICRFCGKHDAQFMVEENLDLHYWMACPMLVSCKLCEQVVEIPTLTSHLMNECEAASEVVLCSDCQRALCGPGSRRHHLQECPGPCPPGNQCPLCHQGIGPGDQGWRQHLLQGDGCPNNTRRGAT